MESRKTILEARQLNLGYGEKTVLSSAGFKVMKGELWVLLGPNGSGKSTLLRSLAGLQPILEGEVLVQGRSINKISARERAKSLSVVLTNPPDVAGMRVLEVLRAGLYPYQPWLGRPDAQLEQSMLESASELGLSDLLDRPLYALSDGQRQTVMLARALVQSTPLIIMDEPTHYLDVIRKHKVYRMIKRLVQDFGKTVVVATHNLEWAWMTADKLGVIADRKLHTGDRNQITATGIMGRAYQDDQLFFDPATGRFSSL